MIELYNHREDVYSQEGEDGIIDELTSQLSISGGNFCEFGAWDGKHLSNCYTLLEQENWSGVMIEADEEKFSSLSELSQEYNKLEVFNKFVETKVKILLIVS